MPLYEYTCDNGHRFELIRKFSDPPLEVCPTCGAPVHKLFSSPAIQFKGSGFYITDYAKKDHVSASQSSDAQAEHASKDKETGEKHDKSDKTEKSEKAEKSESKTETKTSGGDTAPATSTTSTTPSSPAPKKD